MDVNNTTHQISGISTCIKGSPGNTGSYYVQVMTKSFPQGGYDFGFVFSGTPIPGNGYKMKGYPFTGRPAD